MDEHCRALVRPLTEEEEEEEGGRQSGRRVRYRCLACGEVRSHRTLAEVHVSKKHLGHLNPVQCHLCHFRTGHTARLKEHVRVRRFFFFWTRPNCGQLCTITVTVGTL